jgi:hypothetical protein
MSRTKSSSTSDESTTTNSRPSAARPIQRRTDLGHDLIDRDLLGSGPPGYPPNLPIQIRFLISRRHPRIHRSS